ncbi:hypothetical protein [Shewanella sp. SR43-8]|uniref:hypothetical protein n=1 Tax=Shewanella sp. SR43-8 TaxID=2760938 RepID=UPI001603558A|nr:hypothetical protein [Shewanella sp. SR43-8]MBB1320580.1 hypothetical protein [Shewanella sp. SR43-8]
MTQLSDNSVMNNDFSDAPTDAQAYDKNPLGKLFWIKDITATTYKYVFADEINEGFEVNWMRCGITDSHLATLVYRPIDMVESPEEKEAFERISRQQQINAMAAVIRTCPTNSSSGIATLLHEAGCSMETVSELNKHTSPMCEVKFKDDVACFYGFTAFDNFRRSQVGRIIELLKREPELIEVKADRLEAIAEKLVSKAILGGSNTLLLPQASVDWFMGYLLMQEKRAERSIEITRIDPVNQAKHMKRRDIYYQLRTNLARDIYIENRNE